jgi:hypothetical protein
MQPTGTFGASPAPPRRRSRAKLALILAGAAAALLALTAVVVVGGYSMGWYNDDGKFGGMPPPCDVVEGSRAAEALDVEVVRYEPGIADTCDVVPNGGTPYLVAQFFTTHTRTADAPERAGQVMAVLADDARPLSGVGDQAYAQNGKVWVRVSNLFVLLWQAPREAEPSVIEFARRLADHLRRI